MKVVVASTNPVKIESVRKAFRKYFTQENIEFIGTSVESGVKDQPMNEKDTLKGATNRARNAKRLVRGADFYVGIEGGIEKFINSMVSFAWVVTLTRTKGIGMGRTASFFLPGKVIDLINKGYELGDADDIVFGKKNSKQKNGAIGLLTNNVITRLALYEPAVIISLIPFMKVGLY